MAEVVHAKKRAPSYIGDMPHTWVGSGYISAVRTIFAYELEGQLILAAGVDPKWFKEGILVKDLPTLYGNVSYTIKENEGVIDIEIKGEARPPKGFLIPLPAELMNKSICLSGKDIDLENNAIVFDKIPVDINIEINQIAKE
jgi:hypothetical protein